MRTMRQEEGWCARRGVAKADVRGVREDGSFLWRRDGGEEALVRTVWQEEGWCARRTGAKGWCASRLDVGEAGGTIT